MPMSLTSPVTGSAVSGLTSPTFTLSDDLAPEANGRQYAVSALGGTQTGVASSSAGKPFTLTFTRPKVYRNLGSPQIPSGLYSSVPRNTFKLITRKSVGLNGTAALTGSVTAVMNITTTFDVPANSESADPTNVAAAISAHLGSLSQVSSDLSTTVLTGIF